MTESVSFPAWLAVVLVLLAAVAMLDRLLLPGVRWFFRRRVNRAIERFNTRLSIRLQPFKLTRRRVLIDRLVHDPLVMEAVEEETAASGTPREVLMGRVRRYAGEIVPAFNAYLYFRLGYWISRWVASLLYRVRLESSDAEALAEIPPDAAVVFVMNHRSNMDYVLVSYLAAETTALSYAVGEWARIWPLQQLIRAMGAYFVRRGSGNPLYRRVLERYVHMATAAGVTQAVFPEGGLSRDGALRPARLGLLDYMVRDYDLDRQRELVFVPVAINYDRVLEDRTLLLDTLPKEERRRAPALSTTLRFALRNLWQMVRSEWYRFGYACATYGRPISLRAYLERHGVDPRDLPRDERFALVGQLAEELMDAIGRIVPVVPVPLVATVFERTADGEGLSRLEVQARSYQLLEQLDCCGARIYIPRTDQAYAVEVGLRTLLLRHLVVEEDGLLRAVTEQRPVLRYYSLSIAQLLEAEPAGSAGDSKSEKSSAGASAGPAKH